MLFIIYLSYIFLIQPLLEARAEMLKYFRLVWFLVQMTTLNCAFETNLPLAHYATAHSPASSQFHPCS